MLCFLLLMGCSKGNIKTAVNLSPPSVATINPIFLPLPTSTPQPTPLPTSTDLPLVATLALVTETPEAVQANVTPADQPTAQISITATSGPTATRPTIVLNSIYDEKLSANWAVKSSPGLSYVIDNTLLSHDGKKSIAVNFKKDGEYIDFQVQKTSTAKYLRQRTYGVSFWLYSGDSILAIDDLGIGIWGGNQQSYWVANDTTLDTNVFDPVFNQDNLYLLGLNRAVPPKTWVEIVIPMDDLKYRTNYQYVTGIRLRNNAGFHQQIAIDSLALMTIP